MVVFCVIGFSVAKICFTSSQPAVQSCILCSLLKQFIALRCVGYLPNCIETVEAMLATASIGAIWSATSPDFGVTVTWLSVHIASYCG